MYLLIVKYLHGTVLMEFNAAVVQHSFRSWINLPMKRKRIVYSGCLPQSS